MEGSHTDVVLVETSSRPRNVVRLSYRPVTRSQTAEKKLVHVPAKHAQSNQPTGMNLDATVDEDLLDAEGEDDIDIEPESSVSQPPPPPASKFTFVPPSTTPTPQNTPPDRSSALSHKPRIALPVPVPNLTKKSRGRRVPTRLSDANAPHKAKGAASPTPARMYTCNVETCGKCFSRGEHLKRHIRSIHTHDKPFPCPHPDCDKYFSRHDNLLQHQKVHKAAEASLTATAPPAARRLSVDDSELRHTSTSMGSGNIRFRLPAFRAISTPYYPTSASNTSSSVNIAVSSLRTQLPSSDSPPQPSRPLPDTQTFAIHS